MFCTLSGEPALDPVVTPQGILYDRGVIEKHMKQHGTCPVMDTPLSAEDLIPVKLSNPGAVQPRQLTGESVPALLKSFQSEHDAIKLESFSLRSQILECRRELSRTLYQNDAACRVIARLLRERDSVLTEVEQLQKAAGKSIPKMEIEHVLPGLDAETRSKLTQKAQELSTTRKQRVPSPALAPISTIKAYRQVSSFPPHQAARPGILSLDIHPVHQELTITGGVDKTAVIFDRETGKKVATLSGHKKQVTSTLFHPTEEVVITASTDSQVWIWSATSPNRSNYRVVHQLTHHTGEVVQCSLHATREYIATASRDGTWAFHNIKTGQTLLQVAEPEKTPLTCLMLHPDGLILATGTDGSEIRVWDIKSQQNVATFPGHTDAITDLCFSENGYYLATASKDSILKLWDLRVPKIINSLKMDAFVKKLHYDDSGRYLAAATGTEIRIFTGKHLEHVHTLDEHTGLVTDVKFGQNASFLASTSMDRNLKFWG